MLLSYRSKKRKYFEKTIEEEAARHAHLMRDIVHRFSSKRATLFRAVHSEVAAIITDLLALQKVIIIFIYIIFNLTLAYFIRLYVNVE